MAFYLFIRVFIALGNQLAMPDETVPKTVWIWFTIPSAKSPSIFGKRRLFGKAGNWTDFPSITIKANQSDFFFFFYHKPELEGIRMTPPVGVSHCSRCTLVES